MAERPPLRAFSRHRRNGQRDAHRLRPGALVHPRAAEETDRAGRASGRPRVTPDQERDPHDGRRAHSAQRSLADHHVVRSAERLRLGDDRRHRGVRRHRILGRLPEDQAEELARRSGPLQAPRPVCDRAGRSSSYAFFAQRALARRTGGTSASTSASPSSRSPSTRSSSRSGSICRSRCSSSSGRRTP